MDNIWSADLADMQLTSKCYREFYYVLLTFIANMYRLFL